jgi:hypothetical protein
VGCYCGCKYAWNAAASAVAAVDSGKNNTCGGAVRIHGCDGWLAFIFLE